MFDKGYEVRKDPLSDIVEQQGAVVLDGGLATLLEARGHKLDPHLWSAKMLIDSPDEIRVAHRLFLDAGADCVTTATYQASYEGFARLGLGPSDVDKLLILSVTLAQDAVNEFQSDAPRVNHRPSPLVGASIGPYGAFLADGSEYDGRYGVSSEGLTHFHDRRFTCLATAGVDLMAFETIPSLNEARVLLDLLGKSAELWGWMSFSCRDGGHLSDGTSIETAVELCNSAENLVGVGVNCTAPRFVSELIGRIRPKTDKLVLVYPNSGESWDAVEKQWNRSDFQEDWVDLAEQWHNAGAEVIGGCCKIGPDIIKQTRGRIITEPTEGI